MKNLIQDQIDLLRREKGLRVLFAAESGSRAWGFESPDSDYDVRLIYAFPKDRYTEVATIQEDINLPVDDNLIDLSAWELLKAARLVVNKSNASPFEWIQSPIIYEEEPGFRNAFSQAIKPYFRPHAMTHHYLGLAKGTYFAFLQGDEIKIKKYFYALRPILCALWIQEKQTVPPLVFGEVRKVMTDTVVNEAIDQLLTQKETAVEGHLIAPMPVLQGFIHEQLEQLSTALRGTKDKVLPPNSMDQFLREWIH